MTRMSELALTAEHFPSLLRLLSAEDLDLRHEEFERLDVALICQVERDLVLLARYVAEAEISRAYRALLRNAGQFIDAAYEIRSAAMLAPIAEALVLAPAVGKGRCDIECVLGGHRLFVEVSKRCDTWPPLDGTLYSRATVAKSFDPTSRGDSPEYRGTSASEELRDRIRNEASQLPRDAFALIVLGAPETWSGDVEAALFGDPHPHTSSGGWTPPSQRRHLNGLFTIPDDLGGLSRIGGLVWLKLRRSFLDVKVQSRLFINPRAGHPLPRELAEGLLRLFDGRAVLERELKCIKERLIEGYRPERIVLFGSLAAELRTEQDRVHQWSDIDLMVVKETAAKFSVRVTEVLKLVDTRVGLNIFVYTPSEVRRAQDKQGFLRDEILGSGLQLFP
jgi:predicted nucleotidyltransferase